MSRARRLAWLAVIVLLTVPRHVPAHTGGSTGYASITVERSTARYGVTLPAAALPSRMAEDLRLVQSGSAQARERLLDVVRRTIRLRGDGTRCAPGPGAIDAPASDGPTLAMHVDFACPKGLRELEVVDDSFDVLGTDHHTLAKIEWAGRTQQFAFDPATRQARFVLDARAPSARQTGSFVLLGIGHILSGYDHLLFLLGLLLPGGGILALMKIVTAFTLAHSITLSLAVLDVVVLPDRLIEAVIALSIAAVAVENLVRSPAVTRRWIVSFCFGLVHGFGFSSALRELGLPSAGLVLSLFGFNAGVELGQACVVALALPAMAVVRRRGYGSALVRGSSVAILAVGLVLFVERFFFA